MMLQSALGLRRKAMKSLVFVGAFDCICQYRQCVVQLSAAQ